MLPDDLLVYTSARDEQRARLAGSLSVVAIVMLLITSFTLARGVQWNTGAGQSSVFSHAQVPATAPLPYSASAPTINCQKLQQGRWLRAAVCHQGDLTLAGCDCIYGHAASTRFTQ